MSQYRRTILAERCGPPSVAFGTYERHIWGLDEFACERRLHELLAPNTRREDRKLAHKIATLTGVNMFVSGMAMTPVSVGSVGITTTQTEGGGGVGEGLAAAPAAAVRTAPHSHHGP